ncbi:hypothetical protein DFH07DRAFT_952941 [Mycena maculata]|uniref:NmrA-like domain-containing protein n=1 Tax=Mycena maculata TaxID=230809 RepID=A0AAD7JVZ9_9AGAR|nr:hypothetical protein DFH07DRAFT_952941 [Mycena maculata]
MSSSRIVSVFGATGLQGSAVVDALLKDGTFTPRAITRNPDSEKSLELKERGVQVVKADSGDKASLVSALQGSEAVFGARVTVPIFPPIRTSGPNELTQGKNMVDAAKEAGIKFFIFSSLPSLKKLSGGKYPNVSLCEDKDAIEEYLRASGLASASLHLGAFLENFLTNGLLKKTSTGFNITAPGNYSPTSLKAFSWVQRDVGESALTLLKNYTDLTKNISGKSYPVITALMTFPDLVTMISKALGVEVTFTSVATIGIPMFDEMSAAQSEYNGIFTAAQVPNPDLVALGAKFGTMEQFMEKEMKKRFSQ